MDEPAVILHRDDPDKEPLVGHVKVTRDDWINTARQLLINGGVNAVKILTLSEQLNVSRSSFYWYFKSRKELLGALLDDWEQTNTAVFVAHCEKPAQTINGGICNLFRCFINRSLFDHLLDSAIRDWSRHDKHVRAIIDRNDETRLKAITAMFLRYDYEPEEADIRARVLYYMQIGYYALDLQESLAVRMSRLEGYLYSFSGKRPDSKEVRRHLVPHLPVSGQVAEK